MADTIDPDAPPSLVGRTLGGKYHLTRLLGRGGFGEVYEATNTNTEGRVAIKTLHAHLVGHAGVRRRFLAEARAATKVQHDNVIRVFDLDVDAELGVPYIVQEFLAGETLEERLKKSPERQIPPEDALRLAVPVMSALVAAHGLGIVHRDLKPANIFLTRKRTGEEVPTVIDFGIAKFGAGALGGPGTKTGALLGSPAYMSPEQAAGEVSLIDAQTDVWAMGVVLYEMLSGRLPYEADNYNRILGMIQFREPVPLEQRDPSLQHDLVAVINRALTRDRTVRYTTMQAFLGALLETSAWVGFAPASPAAVRASEPGAALRAAPILTPPVEGERKVETLREGWSKEAGRTPSPRVRTLWIALAIMAAVAGIASVALVASDRARAAPQAAAQPPPTPAPATRHEVTPTPVLAERPEAPPAPPTPPAAQAAITRPPPRSAARPRVNARPAPVAISRRAPRLQDLQPDNGYPGQ